jgi:hypothetical protein
MVVDCRALSLSQNAEQTDMHKEFYLICKKGNMTRVREVSGEKDESLHEVRIVLNRASWLKL